MIHIYKDYFLGADGTAYILYGIEKSEQLVLSHSKPSKAVR